MISAMGNAVGTFVTEHRSWFVMLFIMPFSCMLDLVEWAFRMYHAYVARSPEKHKERVLRVQEQVSMAIDAKAAGRKDGDAAKMCTARPGWTTMSLREGKYKKKMQCIDLSSLRDVITIDASAKTVKVEPMCTIGELTAALIPKGWTLPVIPELDGLTIGGLINGFGVETSSHKYGLFQHICVAYEIVLPNGQCIVATKDDHPELFYAIPWSHGTIGFLVSADIKIIPAKNYVKVDYIPAKTMEKCTEIFEMESRKQDNDFVECLMFSADEGVIMVGQMTNMVDDRRKNPIGYYWKPWFYTHVEKYLDSGKGTEYIPLRDYYHRHTRSLFWEIKEIIPSSNDFLFRILFGWLMPPRISLLKITQTESLRKLYEEHHVVQDLLVPMSSLKASIKVMDETCGIYPVWLCPMRVPKTPYDSFVEPSGTDDLFVDVGVYGIPTSPSFKARETVRVIEAFVRQHGGFQALYADSYMTRDEFWQMFNDGLYNKVREMYGCADLLPDVYDKVNRKARI